MGHIREQLTKGRRVVTVLHDKLGGGMQHVLILARCANGVVAACWQEVDVAGSVWHVHRTGVRDRRSGGLVWKSELPL